MVTLNTRVSEGEMAGLLAHSGSSVLVATHEFADRARHLAERVGLPCLIAGGPRIPARSGSPEPPRRARRRSTSGNCWPSTTPAARPAGPRA